MMTVWEIPDSDTPFHLLHFPLQKKKTKIKPTIKPGSSFAVSITNWNLEMLVFVEGRNTESQMKNPQSIDNNQQQSQPT